LRTAYEPVVIRTDPWSIGQQSCTSTAK